MFICIRVYIVKVAAFVHQQIVKTKKKTKVVNSIMFSYHFFTKPQEPKLVDSMASVRISKTLEKIMSGFRFRRNIIEVRRHYWLNKLYF